MRCAEPDGGAWNATIGARVLRRMSFSARFAASANYATTPRRSQNQLPADGGVGPAPVATDPVAEQAQADHDQQAASLATSSR